MLLRIIWERHSFMRDVEPKLKELLDLPYDDPRITDELRYDDFNRELRRAALLRFAEWNYPLDQEPLGMILLPDAQGMLQIAGRGQALWAGQQIAKRDYLAAIDALKTQFACAQHVARGPFIPNQLIAVAIADMGLDRCEILIEQPDSPNLYWAFGLLPDFLGDNTVALHWDAQNIPKSLRSLQPVPPAMNDVEAWKNVANEFTTYLLDYNTIDISKDEAATLKAKMLIAATRFLKEQQEFTDKQLGTLAPEAIVMRWILAQNEIMHAKIETAYSMPAPRALERLVKVEEEIAQILHSVDSPASPFPERPAKTFVALHRFDRRVKLLQTIESIRDYLAKHDDLPGSLDQLELPAPRDPLTELPFEYERNGDTATIRMPIVPGVDQSYQTRRSYTIRRR
ncbi:MAG: hypothetical protein R3C28_27740 [Pirellulaceae bacterium]